ncbi:polyhydroxyalkanoate biosynthesis repressor PhaR [Neobacillus novalis]|uniref:Polyhydroxyalkanoate biosynthesis repressor PhaR n=1 Tax=Neobacillus novalis TaxID=220687 RepID=A0AA95MUZ7_9BACI|nr:hypothetical protein [Neobacillus novalis]WHY87846.1 polyhydroxyalkanoate biosynthesis repressor PhaR [Neobacillus novalis]
MSTGKTYDPFVGLQLVSEMWEKQLNGLLYKLTDNKEFVQTANIGLDVYSRYLERFRKNQELIAALMNIPTKKDIANAAKMSIQAEEKIDNLEEQIWSLQDGLNLANKGNLEMFQEMVRIVKQLQTEFQTIAQEVSETKIMKADLQEIRQGLFNMKIIQVNLQELRKEIDGLKSLKSDSQTVPAAAMKTVIEKEKPKQKKEQEKKQNKELVLTGAEPSKKL